LRSILHFQSEFHPVMNLFTLHIMKSLVDENGAGSQNILIHRHWLFRKSCRYLCLYLTNAQAFRSSSTCFHTFQ